jgi:hypothetical protein
MARDICMNKKNKIEMQPIGKRIRSRGVVMENNVKFDLITISFP